MLTENVLKKGLVLLLCGLCWWSEVNAQDRGGQRSSLPDPLEQYRQRAVQAVGATMLPPMEGAVDPDTYVVGPGDVFGVAIGGMVPLTVTIPVSADGHLVLPDAGSIAVGGETLAVARTKALEALRQQYRNVQVELTLAQPRQFYVHVAGAVPVPRRYLALPVSRISSVVELALADTTRAPVGNFAFQPSLRDVRLRHRDGTEQSADLLRYLTTGETEHNPYVQDGDVIFVPPYDPDTGSLYISGNLPFPGSYPYRPGDTVADLLALATGDATYEAFTSIRLSRVASDGTTEHRMLTRGTHNDERLQPRDHLYVVPLTELAGEATIEGYAQFPGTYPIIDGTTDVRTLIEKAGGLRPDGLGRAAYLVRNPLPEPLPNLDAQQRFGPSPVDPLTAKVDTTFFMQQTRLAEFGFLSRAYFARAFRQQHRIHLNLDDLLQPNSTPFLLRDGDRLVVPRDEGTVLVFGQVNQPGYFPYQRGLVAKAYIEQAGGLGAGAAKAYVIEAGSGRYQSSNTIIRPGDMVFVDRSSSVTDDPTLERLRFEAERNRVDRRSRVAQIALQAASVTLQTVLIIRELRRN